MVGGPQDHWRKVWTKRAPDQVSWFQESPDRSLRLITTHQPDHAGAIIDVGGGASPLVDALLNAGYTNVSVLDIAAQSLGHARQRLGSRAGDARWLVADVTRHQHGDHYATWHDRAVFHFLVDDIDREHYLERLATAVEPGGHAVIATFGPDGPEQCSGLPVRRHSSDELAAALAPAFQPVHFEAETHQTPAGHQQSFVYGVFRREADAI